MAHDLPRPKPLVDWTDFTDKKGRSVALPETVAANGVSLYPIADTHCHLDMIGDPVRALARAALAGIAFLATVTDVTEDASRTFSHLERWIEDARRLLDAKGFSAVALPRVRIVVGAHPHDAQTYLSSADYERVLLEFAADPRVCALGEVGLDYHYDHSPRQDQKEMFERQIQLAHSLDLPLVIHLREAHEDGLAILAREGLPKAGAILHCFNLDYEVARPFLELGCHVSFAGPVTFKRSDDVRASARQMPLEKILTETDSPFMAPEPFRGLECEPAYTSWTASRIAEVRPESAEEFFLQIFGNARKLLDRSR